MRSDRSRGDRLRGDRLRRAGRSIAWYLRELTGEAAYDHYLEHLADKHGHDTHGHGHGDGDGEPPLSRREFERRRAERSAQPGSRCC